MITDRMLQVIFCALALQCGQAVAQSAAPAEQDHRQRLQALERIAPAGRTNEQRLQLARAYYRERRLDEAFQQATDLSQRSPDNAEAWLIQGDIWRERKQWRRALGVINRAAKLDPNRSDIELRRGQALMELGKTQEADAAFARYRLMNPVQKIPPQKK